MEATLLVELLTEELPPKSLARLSVAFRYALVADLMQDGFLDGSRSARAMATPRRLAVLVPGVNDVAPDSEVVAKGPSVKAGLDANGMPTGALLGFARKRGVSADELIRIVDGKQEVFAHRDLIKGSHLEATLGFKVESALKALPIPKIMRWGSGNAQFVRPVHGLVMLHGTRVVPGTVLGLESRNRTRGHRFMSEGEITLDNADEYESTLADRGMVIGDFGKRRAAIEARLKAEAQRLAASLGSYE